jgi:hypothetical protein
MGVGEVFWFVANVTTSEKIIRFFMDNLLNFILKTTTVADHLNILTPLGRAADGTRRIANPREQ